MMTIARWLSRGIHNVVATVVALVLIGGTISLAANYSLTQGSGTTFGSIVVGGINYAQHLLCDMTTPSQCAAVSSGGAVKVDNSGVTQPVSAASLPLPTGAAADSSVGTTNTDIGPPGATACSTDTGSCSVNALAQRLAQRLTSIISTLGSPFQAGGSLAANQSVNVNQQGGAALPKGGIGVVNGGSFYEAVAASQTATVLQSSTGAAGDYLSHCVIYPASTSPGVVTVFDNTNTAANSAILFAGGATSLSNLAPISVPVGAVSVNGAWKVTTGSNVSVVCYGKFS